ncbi:hypothetical protein N185_17340 [Sinorhizobium sp. GW3]|nr:hypothetical protein N185_17340 [Sinorhizobium sp. GW3]
MSAFANSRIQTILVARIWHESNGFNPKVTGPDDFEIKAGHDFLETARHGGSTVGGIICSLLEANVAVVGSLSACAPPSGLVDHAFFLGLRDQLLRDVSFHRPDAIALELHGAMATTKSADAEGLLLAELRALVGPQIPIAIGLDLHANLTVTMIEAVDICIACKENPHSDVVDCGRKVADGVLAMMDGRLKPVAVMVKVPMILPGAGETAVGPLSDLHRMARDYLRDDPDIWDISLFNVFPYSDDDNIGQTVVVTTNGTPSSTSPASTLAEAFWTRRHEFVDDLVSIDEALTRAAHGQGQPCVLADMGDRILAGAPGDSTAILEAALNRYPGLRGAASLTDPEGVLMAKAAGKGAPIEIEIGGRVTPGFRPLPVKAIVTHLGDGKCTLAGPFQGGEACTMGETAVVEIDGRLSVLLTSRPAFSHDPAVFTSQNVTLSDKDFIVVKSGYHFKLNFAEVGEPLLVRSPGVGYYEKGFFTYQRARFWPEHEVSWLPITTVVRRPIPGFSLKRID